MACFWLTSRVLALCDSMEGMKTYILIYTLAGSDIRRHASVRAETWFEACASLPEGADLCPDSFVSL